MSELLLSGALRQATAAAHDSAESSAFITDLMAGRACRSAFVALAVQQFVMYTFLERAVARYADNPLLAPLDDRALDRVPALTADLQALCGVDAPAALASGALHISAATEAYADVVEAAGPEQLVGHHYTRYLGDLSGGQVIAALVARHYGIGRDGLQFYQFPAIGKLKPYKDRYRLALDGLTTTPAQRAAIVAGAADAFALTEAVFADLGRIRRRRHAAAGMAA